MDKVSEWCMLWTSLCLKSEVWAAWVQGVGSVLAIAAAVTIAWWQQRAERVRREVDRQDAANKKEIALNEFWRATQLELRELRYRCALAAYDVYKDLGRLDRDFLIWIYRIVHDYDGPNSKDSIRDLVTLELQQTDHQLTIQQMAAARKKSETFAKTFQKYSTPVLNAKLAELSGLPLETQALLQDVIAQIAMFNDGTEQAAFFLGITWQEISSENHRGAAREHMRVALNVAGRAKSIATRISDIPELALRTPTSIPQPTESAE